MSASAHVKTSAEHTTRSAHFPGSSEPSSASWWAAYAFHRVNARTASPARHPLIGLPARVRARARAARHRGVDPVERVRQLDREVGAAGDHGPGREERAPGVGAGEPIGAEPGRRPGHVGGAVRGLHAREDAERAEAGHVARVEELGVLDPVTGSAPDPPARAPPRARRGSPPRRRRGRACSLGRRSRARRPGSPARPPCARAPRARRGAARGARCSPGRRSRARGGPRPASPARRPP